MPYNNPIKIKTASLGDTEEKSITIHDYYDINLGYIVDYSCNGNIIGEQLKRYGPITIPAYERVNKVKIDFTYDSVDDRSVIRIGDFSITSFSQSGVAGTYDIKLDSSEIYIDVGAKNTDPDLCYLRGGKLKVTFLYN